MTNNGISRKSLFNRFCDLTNTLIRESPPFDITPQNPLVFNHYKAYILFYDKFDKQFKDKFIKAQKAFAFKHLSDAIFGFDAEEYSLSVEHIKFDEEFGEWYRENMVFPEDLVESKEDRINIQEILKKRVPERFSGMQYRVDLKKPSYFPFSKKGKSFELLVGFDSGSYNNSLSLLIGLTEPVVLTPLLSFYGGGNFACSFNTLHDFNQKLDLMFKILEDFLPKFEKAIE